MEGSFRLYRAHNAMEILTVHRVPPYRLGWPVVGSLGGATAREMTEIYKRSVAEPGQEILERRLNGQLFSAFEPDIGKLAWRWKLNDLDLSDKMAELDCGIKAVERVILTPNQARGRLGLEPYTGGDVYYMPSILVPVGEGSITKAGAEETPADWIRLHRHHEQVLGEKVRGVFAARRSAR